MDSLVLNVEYSKVESRDEASPIGEVQVEQGEARALLLYLGEDRLRLGDVDCIPCAEFLASVVPGEPLA